MEPLRAVFMGSPDFAAACLGYLAANGMRFVAVYCQPDRPAGRGRGLVPPPVKLLAQDLGLPVLQPRNFRNPDSVTELAGIKPDVVVVAAYGNILSRSVLDIPRLGCLNIHPSLLPKFRGVSPIPASIIAGDRFTGVSVMLLDAGTDTGPVFTRAQVPILDTDTASTLSGKLALIGAQLVLDVLPSWSNSRVAPLAQDESSASYCNKLAKEDGEIDWRIATEEIWRRIRAYHPWPGSYTYWQRRTMKILGARPGLAGSGGTPGSVVAVPDDKSVFGVVTCDGILAVSSVQLEGKKEMLAGDFLRGQRGLVGSVLG
jgi:methionyl-tRNA formyltransferase